MKVIKTAKYEKLASSIQSQNDRVFPYVILWNIDYEKDPREPSIKIEFDYRIYPSEPRTWDYPGAPASFDLHTWRITAMEDTIYGPAGSDITQKIERDQEYNEKLVKELEEWVWEYEDEQYKHGNRESGPDPDLDAQREYLLDIQKERKSRLGEHYENYKDSKL